MKVYFDIITNHTADVIGYEEGARTAYVSKDCRALPHRGRRPRSTTATTPAQTTSRRSTRGRRSRTRRCWSPARRTSRCPRWLNDLTLYHNRGNTTFVGEDSYYGDFFGLDDLFTEHPTVVNGMIDIYKTWIGDLGIDGFRIDTMKHVNDEFWQKFGPEVLAYAKSQGKDEFFMFGEVFDTTRPFTSQFTTRNKMQAVLDFPFQDAARNFASKGQPTDQLETFFRDDDWYTDADSNVYQLPTFLGNHDMGRIGSFINADNPGATEAELVARDRLAHELMYFSRGNPVDLLRRRAGLHRHRRRPGGPPDDVRQPGSRVPRRRPARHRRAPMRRTTSTPPIRCTARSATSPTLTKDHPALRNGAHQHRYASDAAGIYAFSRMPAQPAARVRGRAEQQRVGPRPRPSPPTSRTAPSPGSTGRVRSTSTSNGNRRLSVTVPALSTVVYKSVRKIPRSNAAPQISLNRPATRGGDQLPDAGVGRTSAAPSFNEVTFYAKAGSGGWKSIGTDDTRPYRVFHDVSSIDDGDRVAYRAVVRDNAGHTRVERPAAGDRSAAGADHQAAGRRSRSVRHDRGPGARRSGTGHPRGPDPAPGGRRRLGDGARPTRPRRSTATTTTCRRAGGHHDPVPGHPPRAGRHPGGQCRPDGQPGGAGAPGAQCDGRRIPAVGDRLRGRLGSGLRRQHLTFDTSDGLWKKTFTLPAGDYEWKVAINDSWDVNYGAGGAAGGSNLTLSLATESSVTFVWDQVSKVPTATVG